MGVNLKELGLMLVILIAIGAGLVIYFLNTQAKREGEAFVRNTNDAVLNATSKNDNYKKKNSITASIMDLVGGKSLGGVSVDFFSWGSIVYTYGINGEKIYDGEVPFNLFSGAVLSGGTYTKGNNTIDGNNPKIYLALIPRKSVEKATTSNVVLLAKQKIINLTGGSTEITGDQFEKLTPAQKGYVGEAFLVYGAFDNKNEAKTFRDKYFPSANIFQAWDDLYYIAVESGF